MPKIAEGMSRHAFQYPSASSPYIVRVLLFVTVSLRPLKFNEDQTTRQATTRDNHSTNMPSSSFKGISEEAWS